MNECLFSIDDLSIGYFSIYFSTLRKNDIEETIYYNKLNNKENASLLHLIYLPSEDKRVSYLQSDFKIITLKGKEKERVDSRSKYRSFINFVSKIHSFI